MYNKETPNLNAILNEIEELKEGVGLLEEIWSELGPYTDHLPIELRIKLQRYFNFDDSE